MKYKKLLRNSLIWVVVLSMTIVNVAAASPIMKKNTIETNLQNVAQKVSFMLPLLCEDLSENCILGEKLSSYVAINGGVRQTDYEIYPVISENKIVALAQVITTEAGAKSVSCITAYANELQKFYDEKNPVAIAIVFAHDGVYALCKDESPLLIYETNIIGACCISDTMGSKRHT